MEEITRKFEHRQLMVKISQSLCDSDLSGLKYFYGDMVTESALGEVKTPTDLFTLLQYHSYLGPNCYESMKRGLLAIERNDLALMLPSSQESAVQACSGQDIYPRSHCELKHRMMLVSVADRMRREDVLKLAYTTTGKVRFDNGLNLTDSVSIAGLQLLVGLEDLNVLSCGNYSVLCDLLHQIGRCDLADFIVGFPRNIPSGFTMQRQALNLKMEVLRNKRSAYILHRKKLTTMKEGDDEMVRLIHTNVLGICVDGLSTRCAQNYVSSILELLQNSFDSQHMFLQCVLSDVEPDLKHREEMNFINDAFGCDDNGVLETRPCIVAESAHRARIFILEASCELIGNGRVTEVHQLNNKVEHGINICSRYANHVFSFLSCLAGILTAVSRKELEIESYRKGLTEIITNHKSYIKAALPLLIPYLKLKDLSRLSELGMPCAMEDIKEIEFNGLVAMVMIPSYVLLLNLFFSLDGGTVNADQVLGKLVEYVSLSGHIVGSKEFIQKSASAMHDNISCFRQDVIELDILCAPLIRELL